jgi:hypothetical protein
VPFLFNGLTLQCILLAMKNNPVSIIVMILLAGIVAWMVIPSFSGVELPVVNMSAMGSENVKARVEEIIEEGM